MVGGLRDCRRWRNVHTLLFRLPAHSAQPVGGVADGRWQMADSRWQMEDSRQRAPQFWAWRKASSKVRYTWDRHLRRPTLPVQLPASSFQPPTSNLQPPASSLAPRQWARRAALRAVDPHRLAPGREPTGPAVACGAEPPGRPGRELDGAQPGPIRTRMALADPAADAGAGRIWAARAGGETANQRINESTNQRINESAKCREFAIRHSPIRHSPIR